MAVLIAARIGMGVGEAGLFPAIYELFGRWVPRTERGRAVAFMSSGVPVGSLGPTRARCMERLKGHFEQVSAESGGINND